MAQPGTPAAAPMNGPGLSAGTNDVTNGGSENRALIFENPLLRRETPVGFTFESSELFLAPLCVVCPVTKVGAVKSQPLVIAAPEGVRGILQKYQEYYEGTKQAIGLSKYPMMSSWYHESADSIMEALEGVSMSPEAKEHLMNGPCGIRKHVYLFSLMQSHPEEFECDTGTDVESELSPWNQVGYRRYVRDISGYCVNLVGGVYHEAYGRASKENMDKWTSGPCTVQQLLAPAEPQPSPSMAPDARKRARVEDGESDDVGGFGHMSDNDLRGMEVFLNKDSLNHFNTAIIDKKYDVASDMFEKVWEQGKLVAGRYARLETKANGLNQTIFAMKIDEDRLQEYVSERDKNWQAKCDQLKQKVSDQEGEVSWARIQMDSALEHSRSLESKAKLHVEQMATAVKSASAAVAAEHNTFKSEICGVLRRHGMESLAAPPFAAPHAPEPTAPGAMNPDKPPCAENAVQWIQYINSTNSVPDKVMAEFLNATHCMTCKVLKGKCFYCGGPVVDAPGHGNFKHSDGRQKGTLVSACLCSPQKGGAQCSLCVRNRVQMSVHSVDACLFDMAKLRMIVNHPEFVEKISQPSGSSNSARASRGHSGNANSSQARPPTDGRGGNNWNGNGGYNRGNTGRGNGYWRN